MEIEKYSETKREQVLRLIVDFQTYITETDTKGMCCEFASDEDAKKYLEQLIRDAQEKEGIFLLAIKDGEIVGFIQGIIDRHTDDLLYSLCHKPGAYGWIGELYTRPEFRGQGIAKKLIEKIENYFKQNNCVATRIYVMTDNKLALAAYEKLGYETRDMELSKEL
ncbi:MAG: GNAT family N-acetyltransferase [Candidatus Berkelbacteria bacterium]|nr:GNAT family N-acetyltransferase [Candidatus Berkelbacteria bacterium]